MLYTLVYTLLVRCAVRFTVHFAYIQHTFQYRDEENPIYIAVESNIPSPPVSTTVSAPTLERLITVFGEQLSSTQVKAVYSASGESLEASMECLLEGPNVTSLLNTRFRSFPVVKLDPNDRWHDMLVYYKTPALDLSNKPAIQFTSA